MEVVVCPWPQPVMECLLAFGAVQLVVGMYYIRVYKPLVCMHCSRCGEYHYSAQHLTTILQWQCGVMWLLQNANRFDAVYSVSPR